MSQEWIAGMPPRMPLLEPAACRVVITASQLSEVLFKMPFLWKMGKKSPYACNHFAVLRVGPNTRLPEIIQTSQNILRELQTGNKVCCACGHEVDLHQVRHATIQLLEAGSLAEELLLVHPQPPRVNRKNTPPDVLAENLRNPDRIALAELGMEPMGWTRLAYCPKAFDIWCRQLELLPDDPLTLHHMAIMHHARAFDLEAGPKPTESDADWGAAMGFWHRLHAMDTFWDNLTAKACAGTASTM